MLNWLVFGNKFETYLFTGEIKKRKKKKKKKEMHQI